MIGGIFQKFNLNSVRFHLIQVSQRDVTCLSFGMMLEYCHPSLSLMFFTSLFRESDGKIVYGLDFCFSLDISR